MVAGKLMAGRIAMLIAVTGFGLSGCTAAQKEGADANPLASLQGETQESAESQPPAGPTYTVEIRREGFSPEFVRIPYPGETHLQNALEKSGAAKKLKRMELYVLRKSPEGGPRQRMTSAYDSVNHRVAWESDYAVYPGDHIVAIEDTSSQLDEIMNRFLGPLGKSK